MRRLFLFVVLFFATLVGANVIGSVESVKGIVKVKSDGSFKKSKVKVGLEVNDGDLITTSKKGSLVIKLVDGSTVIVDVSSSIHFKDNNTIEQNGGKVFYKITSRGARNSLKIKTQFAIIGIKGTTFIVDGKKDGSVLLKEGLIGVESIKEEFELYRKKVQDEFKSYVSKTQSEFDKFKNAQDIYAVAEAVNMFDLKSGNRISFSGNRVNEDAWNKNDDAEFKHFEELMSSMK